MSAGNRENRAPGLTLQDLKNSTNKPQKDVRPKNDPRLKNFEQQEKMLKNLLIEKEGQYEKNLIELKRELKEEKRKV